MLRYDTWITRLSIIIEKNKGNCEVFVAPFDVRLPQNGEKADEQIYKDIF